jgi:hypothetical protein
MQVTENQLAYRFHDVKMYQVFQYEKILLFSTVNFYNPILFNCPAMGMVKSAA